LSRTFSCRAAVVSLWSIAVASGAYWLMAYQAVPGAHGRSPSDWPPDSTLRPASVRFTLLMFVHPHCPCSRASLTELNWIRTRAEQKLEPVVVFVVPPGACRSWGQSPLWHETVGCGVAVTLDAGGREAGRFGARTSGQVLLYDASGRLIFAGGITDGRGHAGDNAGRRAVLECLCGENVGQLETPVFGCPLVEEEGE
jgi:hypothetical protein